MALADAHGIAIVAGAQTAVAGRVVVYDASGGELAAQWSLARGLAYAMGVDVDALLAAPTTRAAE